MTPLPIDWNAADGSKPPGVYLACVDKCELKHSKASGAPMLALTINSVDFGGKLCYDYLMLSGDGWGMGKSKLKALGFKEGSTIEEHDLIGIRFYCAVVAEEFNGRKQLKVNAKLGHAGYWNEQEPPAGLEVWKPDETLEADISAESTNDSPF